jgi:AbrB family looped-hinge helix DNA binding protein
VNVILDPSGRIELPDALRARLGLKSGDGVVIEEEDGRWVIRPAQAAEPLQWEGNVLVHKGVLLGGATDPVDEIRRQRQEEIIKGDST